MVRGGAAAWALGTDPRHSAIATASARAAAQQNLISRAILQVRFVMDSTVDLDDNLAFGTAEINDIASQRVLPTKLHVIQTPRSQTRPQLAFSLCLNMPEALGGRNQSKANSQAWPPPSLV